MCGIAGWIGNSLGEDALGQRLGQMLASLSRRGPDGEGTMVRDGFALGHRRLAIFDLSDAGRQPMSTPDGVVTVVFNGAIYNWLDLRSDLESHGARFHSQTDTEVLLSGYRHWGIDGLVERLRGMFAFGIWDEGEQVLHLVRDRLGVKPLIYTRPSDGSIAFASTPRALKAAGLGGEVNPAALGAMIRLGHVPESSCIWTDLHKLPPATILRWTRRDGVQTRKYWQQPDTPERSAISFADAVDATEAALLEAVRCRLAADVPVGCLLSGGVDSSLVAWAASQLHADIRTFTVSTPGNPADEAPTARATAKHLGLRHEVLPMDSAKTGLTELTAAFAEPFGVSSALGLLAVSQAVRPHATVLLTGDGGDEGFLGYPEHRVFWMAERLGRRVPRPASLMLGGISRLALRAGAGPLRRPVRVLDYATRGMAAVHDAQRSQWEASWQAVAGPRLTEVPGLELERAPGNEGGLMQQYIHHQQATAFGGEYLPKVDGATMHHALEARSPFLDHELWTLAATLPWQLRLQRGELKAVLRTLARRHLTPEVAAGRKRGFTIPVQEWLVREHADRLDRLATDSALVAGGWCVAAGIKRLVESARRSGQASLVLWHLVAAEAWLERNAQPRA
ncbi:MAG: asparagine synthase (glutamine-hydrolyzing) [Gemmatimonadales bacterium]|nr:asparagine synthase (glutamine-hydrolyzing) [Gemmatimonadales bacterium]